MSTRLLLAACLALPLLACGDKDEDDELVDEDGDGVAEDEDCDDGDPERFPGNTEVCDSVDNDCDGEIDEDLLVTVYEDGDGDGWGSEVEVGEACEAADGQSVETGDCDDARDDVYPGADEPDCTDPTDYNCDGEVEYADSDGDGWADCEDCSPDSAEDYPGADELCDGVDNDCDGETDEDDAVDALTWYADLDEDGFGDPDNTALSCEQPSGFTDDASDCDDDDASVNPGAEELCDAVDTDCDGTVGETLVPTDHADVQSAVDAGVTDICVEAGTHVTNVYLDATHDPVSITGVDEATAILDGDGLDQVISCDDCPGLSLSQLTIQGGDAITGSAGGVWVTGDSGEPEVSVSSVTFTSNITSSGVCYGTALGVLAGGPVRLTDVTATANGCTDAGDGVTVLGTIFLQSLDVEVDGVEIYEESVIGEGVAYSLGLTAFSLSETGSTASINELHVWDTSTEGVFTYGVSNANGFEVLDLTHSSFINNTFDDVLACVSLGFFPWNVEDTAMSHVDMRGNRCTTSEQAYPVFMTLGQDLSTSSLVATNVVIAGNTLESGNSYSGGGVVMDWDLAESTWTNCSITGNTVTSSGELDAGWYALDATVSLVNVDYSGNTVTADSYSMASGFGIADPSDSSITWSYSNLADLGDTPFGPDLTDPTGSDGNISVDPDYTDTSSTDPADWDLTLASGSSLIDAGDPSLSDADGSTSDIGAYGGPAGEDW